jgi:hypothetical protein
MGVAARFASLGTGSGASVVSPNMVSIATNAASLWKGRFSIEAAYRNQQGWPGRLPFGAVYPAMEEVWRIVPPRGRIWSFHIHSYCMLPDCNVQGFLSFRFSPSWEDVFLGTPDAAVKALKAEGLNYFFYSSELQMHDLLPYAPIFSPDQIERYLGVRWTDGVSYLLTWRSEETPLLSQEFLTAYRKSVAINNKFMHFDSGQWKRTSQYVDDHRSDLHGFILPWCVNCGALKAGITN